MMSTEQDSEHTGRPRVPVWQRLCGLALGVAVAALLTGQLTGPWLLLWLVGSYCWPEVIELAAAAASGEIWIHTPSGWYGAERRNRANEEQLNAFAAEHESQGRLAGESDQQTWVGA